MSKKNRDQAKAVAAPKAAGPWADYVWANLIFFAFLILLSFVVWQSCQAPGDDPAVKLVLNETFKFMIFLFGGGFLIVTLFDAAYDFFEEKAEAPESPETPLQ